MLIRVYEMQARFDDVRRVLRGRIAAASRSLEVLRELDNLNQGRHAYDGLRAALEQAGREAPDDDRVWLGRGRLAIAVGRWDEAADWLGRCSSVQSDAPVWRACLDRAMGVGQPDEALRAWSTSARGTWTPPIASPPAPGSAPVAMIPGPNARSWSVGSRSTRPPPAPSCDWPSSLSGRRCRGRGPPPTPEGRGRSRHRALPGPPLGR